MFFLDESCRAIRFQERIEGKVLTNYVFKSYQGINEEMCEINCFLEPGCVSYNHGTMGDGLFLCELSAREHMEVPSSELVTKDGFIYRAISIVSGKSCSYYSSMRDLLPWNYFCLSFLVSCLEKKSKALTLIQLAIYFLFLFFSFLLQNFCASNPCSNNSTCQTGFGKRGFRCLCSRGYVGDNCELGKWV